MHIPVLLNEVLTALDIDKEGCYVDCTFGNGGHSRAILQSLAENGFLLAMDRDPNTAKYASDKAFTDKRFRFFQDEYVMLSTRIKEVGMQGKVSGIVLDLGVSSEQLDCPQRGFSFRYDGLLDMRMDSTSGYSAREWLNQAKEGEIADVIYQYGEEPHARKIAGAIIKWRLKNKLETTRQLANLVQSVYPIYRSNAKKIHPATKTFQSIRIFINQELEQLQEVLNQVFDVLAPYGRLIVISFHSLEDRIVKRFIRNQRKQLPPELPIPNANQTIKLRAIGKPIRPSTTELKCNPRARSAIMRIAERTAAT